MTIMMSLYDDDLTINSIYNMLYTLCILSFSLVIVY